jgi:hypothetical protein
LNQGGLEGSDVSGAREDQKRRNVANGQLNQVSGLNSDGDCIEITVLLRDLRGESQPQSEDQPQEGEAGR